nr:hypothetical protein [Tanacetum cinerariifolium]
MGSERGGGGDRYGGGGGDRYGGGGGGGRYGGGGVGDGYGGGGGRGGGRGGGGGGGCYNCEKNVVIFDMGGKRFEVSLVNLNKAGFISVKSSSGDPHMGGDDFVHENIINAHTDVANVEDEDV